MEKIVLGLFDDTDSAQDAVHMLEAEGFPRAGIDLRSGRDLMQQTDRPSDTSIDEGVWASIKRFFSGPPSEGRLSSGELHGINESDMLVTVHTDDARAERAAEIMDECGAEDIDERMESPGAAQTAATSRAPGEMGNRPAQRAREAGEQKIPVTEEELRVGKREVGRGGVRVRSRIIERPVEEDVTLREEQVRVERHPVDRPITETGEGAFREQSFEVRATSEEPIVEKRARVKEEVSVKKDVRQRKEKVKDTVRRTEVEVDPLSPEERREFASYASEFQSDWQSKHANRTGLKYEDVEPGYQYGYHLGRGPEYSDAEWTSVEAKVKRDWDEHGYGPWDQFKDAVRSGWERAHRH